jgi:Protein of unknown function (DUF2911)
MRHDSRLAAAATVLLALAAPGTLAAQGQQQPSPSHAGAFVVRLGTDTIAVERFSRQGNEYGVEQVRRVPRTALWHTHVGLTPTGEVADIFLMNHSLERMDAPLLASVKLVSATSGDSASVEMRRGADSARTRRVAVAAGMIPTLPQSYLAYELAAMRLRRSGADSARVVFLFPSGDTMSLAVRKLGADSMTFSDPDVTYRARVDADGRIQRMYLPLGTSVERVANVDINAIAKAWGALDAAGKAMGPLSPLDSTSAQLGAARVSVRYSRPKSRGRPVFGALVPFDTVWRTGANAATVLETDRDLLVGTTPLPAGRYTLFTLPTRTGTTLVISKQTERNGQPLFGTEYDPAQDFARVPMTTRTLAAPVEQLTIAVVPQGRSGRGTLRVSWANREMTVPVRVK